MKVDGQLKIALELLLKYMHRVLNKMLKIYC